MPKQEQEQEEEGSSRDTTCMQSARPWRRLGFANRVIHYIQMLCGWLCVETIVDLRLSSPWRQQGGEEGCWCRQEDKECWGRK